MTEELIAKAKEAQSPEELLALAHENGMEEFTRESAEELYAQMHTSGELSDEEMENVAGGGCVSVGGQKYKMVSSGTDCFNMKWECGFSSDKEDGEYGDCKRTDHKSLRGTWSRFATRYECGSCIHLGFTKALTGYCEVEHS